MCYLLYRFKKQFLINKSSEHSLLIPIGDILEVLERYFTKDVFKVKRDCGMQNVQLLNTKNVAFNFGPSKGKNVFDSLNISINISFDEMGDFIKGPLSKWVEKQIDKKVISSKIKWGKRADGFYYEDDAEVVFKLK